MTIFQIKTLINETLPTDNFQIDNFPKASDTLMFRELAKVQWRMLIRPMAFGQLLFGLLTANRGDDFPLR